MNSLYKNAIIVTFILLVATNIVVFISGVSLSDQINNYDKEISRYHQENLELEKQLYSVESLNYASTLASKMNFVKTSPVYIENIKVALK